VKRIQEHAGKIICNEFEASPLSAFHRLADIETLIASSYQSQQFMFPVELNTQTVLISTLFQILNLSYNM